MKLEELFEGAVVAQLELPEPVTVKAGAKLSDAVKAMREGKRGAVIVTGADGKGVSGILTEVDFVKKILGKGLGDGAKVDEVMTAKPETVSPETKLSQAFELMSRGNFRHLPVISSGGTCGGVLAVRDINRFLAERFPQDVLALPPDIHQVLAVDGG